LRQAILSRSLRGILAHAQIKKTTQAFVMAQTVFVMVQYPQQYL
jgi:hypothetical protein